MGRARTLTLVGLAIAVAAKVAVAARLDLFCDEAFYWVSGQRPAIGYVDHPPITALLVRGGNELFGNTLFGVRFSFLLIGLALPLVVYRLGRELVGERDGWLAAGASLLLPVTFHPGLAAVPDAPLILFATLLLLSLVRATKSGKRADWLRAGLWAALGLSTHYRFSVIMMAVLLFLTVTSRGRRHWRDRGLWIGAAVASIGLLPPLIYNVQNDFGPLRYHLAGRHGSSLKPEALLEYLGTQAGLVTPLLFVALMAALIALVRRARAGDERAALVACFSATPLLLYFVASPLEDTGLTTMHWPAPGYIPLLVYLPDTLRKFVAAKPSALRRVTAALTPILGGLVVCLLLVELGLDSFKLSNVRWHFYGWSQVGEEVTERLEGSEDKVLVADNYVLAVQLMFELGRDRDVYVLDHPENTFHGRARQIDVWEMGEAALATRAGEPALFVAQMDETPGADREAWLEYIATWSDDLQPEGELRVDSTWRKKRDGRWKYKLFRFFSGGVRAPD